MNTDKILSVVIPVYNERATILKIIEKVCALDFGKAKRWRICELPISYYGRNYAEGKKISRRHGFSAL